jgi:hypothetical protein
MKHTNVNTRGALILIILAFVSTIIGANACQPQPCEPKPANFEAGFAESESGESSETAGESLQSIDVGSAIESSAECWTYLGKPKCEQDPIPQFTCCDGVNCHTFDSEPSCATVQNTYVCCEQM